MAYPRARRKSYIVENDLDQFRVCSRDICDAKNTQKNIFQFTLGQVFFSPRLTGLLFPLYDIIRHLRGFM